MAPSPLQLRRTQNTLLFQKLLNLRDGASPFTLVLDSLEQPGALIIEEFVQRAIVSRSQVVFVSFTTLYKEIKYPVDRILAARGKSLAALNQEITAHLANLTSASSSQKILIIFDTLNSLTTPSNLPHLASFLSSLLISPSISLLATYHIDIPTTFNANSSYLPSPLTTLTYLATAILRVRNLNQVIAQKRAQSRSLQPPVFGLAEHKEGLIIGLNPSFAHNDGPKTAPSELEIVVEMEMRRKSGRGIIESFILTIPSPQTKHKNQETANQEKHNLAKITLLDDHFSIVALSTVASMGDEAEQAQLEDLTFKLGLSEKERRDREDIILPYFDAQKEGGGGEGGRILYEMGKEDWDDFDEEEDEI